MSHPRWPGFNHRTGNPAHDNRARNLNLRMWRETKASIKVTAANRKRKKLIKRVEGGNYIKIIASVMDNLSRERNRAVEQVREASHDAV